jgi:hypothetical protein
MRVFLLVTLTQEAFVHMDIWTYYMDLSYGYIDFILFPHDGVRLCLCIRTRLQFARSLQIARSLAASLLAPPTLAQV